MGENINSNSGIDNVTNVLNNQATDTIDTSGIQEKPEELEHTPIDGTFEVITSSNYSESVLRVTPPYFGGNAILAEQVFLELTRQKVSYGINVDLINKIISSGLYNENYKIAEWTPSVNGVNGTITYHFDKNVEIKPKENEDGFVDYRDLGYIRNITQGTVIADITMPTEGSTGTNVRNEKIIQKVGVPANAAHGEGIGLSGNGEQLIALTDGNLKYSAGKFSIETMFNMRGNIDASTGNIDFIGDIVIRGEIMEGFKITSKKSITVFENATGAILQAGGDVIIKKGCIATKIISKGNVSVNFAENAEITCDGNVKGDIFITSNVHCGGELTASGTKGLLMGGKYTCLKNLIANSIGTKSYGTTIVTVGDNAIMLEEKSESIKKLAEYEANMINCTQIINFLNVKKRESGGITPEREVLLSKTIKQKIMLQIDIGKLESRINEIERYLENRQNLSIICKKHLYPGTKITINDFVMQVNDLYQYCKISLGDDGIKVETL